MPSFGEELKTGAAGGLGASKIGSAAHASGTRLVANDDFAWLLGGGSSQTIKHQPQKARNYCKLCPGAKRAICPQELFSDAAYARAGERLPPSTVATGKSLCVPLRLLL